ncbi:MAG: hypothetical protein QXU11_11905 [Thermoproteota archaeon]|uniref:hypothetical protein n=1 Tax=Thermofilum sp. TaxID=1961369 RepID=UPI00315E495D
MSEIIDWGVEAGTNSQGLDKTTINNLISTFYGEEDVVKGVIITQLYVARQRGRDEIPFKLGSLIMEHISKIYDKYKDDKEKLRESMEMYLMAFKWSYESKIRNARNFNEFVLKASGR